MFGSTQLSRTASASVSLQNCITEIQFLSQRATAYIDLAYRIWLPSGMFNRVVWQNMVLTASIIVNRPEDGLVNFLRNSSNYLQDYTAIQPRRSRPTPFIITVSSHSTPLGMQLEPVLSGRPWELSDVGESNVHRYTSVI
jgi:hypothetical protein